MLGLGLSLTQVAVRGGGRTFGAAIIISKNNQDENTAIGTTIGNVSVVGGTGTYTFTKTADPDSAFTFASPALKNAIVFDYETATAHSVTIHADNGAGSVLNRTFSISVNDIDEVPPVITSSPTQTIPENSAFSMTLTADKAATWSKTGGADTALFTLTGSTLSLPAQDFEAPTDANADNAYIVQVTATSLTGFSSSPQTITLTVTDVTGVAPGTPTIAWTSAATVNPPVFSFTAPTDPDLVVGDNVHFQRSTVSDFSSGVTDYNNTVDAGEDAANALTFSSGTWTTATNYWVRARTERGEGISAWSNTVNINITSSSTLKTGLISYWEFETTSWLDSHTTGNNLTAVGGSPLSDTGLVGNAFDTNSTVCQLQCASNTSLQTGGQDYSIAVWFLKGDTGFDRDLCNKSTVGSGNQEYTIHVRSSGSGGQLEFNLFDSTGALDTLAATTFGAIGTGTWHLGICTYNHTTGVMTVSVDAGTRNTFTSAKTTVSGAAAFVIGNGPDNGWHTKIDQLGFWKKVLTTTEETFLYNGGAGRTYASL